MVENKELIKNLLIYIEENAENNEKIAFTGNELKEYSKKDILDHVDLLKKSYYVKTKEEDIEGSWVVTGLTEGGYGYLDEMRSRQYILGTIRKNHNI